MGQSNSLLALSPSRPFSNWVFCSRNLLALQQEVKEKMSLLGGHDDLCEGLTPRAAICSRGGEVSTLRDQ
jgi:hypothetical protein